MRRNVITSWAEMATSNPLRPPSMTWPPRLQRPLMLTIKAKWYRASYLWSKAPKTYPWVRKNKEVLMSVGGRPSLKLPSLRLRNRTTSSTLTDPYQCLPNVPRSSGSCCIHIGKFKIFCKVFTFAQSQMVIVNLYLAFKNRHLLFWMERFHLDFLIIKWAFKSRGLPRTVRVTRGRFILICLILLMVVRAARRESEESLYGRQNGLIQSYNQMENTYSLISIN